MSDFLKDIIKETGNEYATLAKDDKYMRMRKMWREYENHNIQETY